MKLNVLGVIPARGGSKSIHRKNLVQLAGRPLIDYAIKAAIESRCLTRTILSTEDEEIRKVAKLCGADVPFIRPFDLATDEAPSVAVAQHALEYMEKEDGRTYDLMCLLQPTAPLRTSEDIDSAITMLINSDADSVISLTQVIEPHPAKMICLSDGLATPFLPQAWSEHNRRQDLEPVYCLNGSVYCVRRNVLMSGSLWGQATLGYVMPQERSVNIDDSADLLRAECMLRAESINRVPLEASKPATGRRCYYPIPMLIEGSEWTFEWLGQLVALAI